MRVLITDANERAALAATRSLVAAGYEVYAAAPTRLSLAGSARGARPLRLDADPLHEPERFARAVGQAAGRLQARVVLPITDASADALLVHRVALPPAACLPLPDLEVYRAASDKVGILPMARGAGLDVPETVVLDAPPPASHLPPPDFFPAVLKPHRSVVPVARGTRRRLGVSFADDAEGCRRALTALPPGAFPVLVQRRVRGPGEGLFLLRWDGRVVAAFAHRRLREKPPEGGVSVYRESIPMPPELLSAGTQLLDALDWRGVAMIECKRDLETGRHVLMEVNGRFWGSLQLAIDAGVDFPALLVACALGGTPSAPSEYHVGVRGRWFWGDVDHLYLRFTRGNDGARGSRLSALVEFLRFRRGRDHEDVWRWRDPGPFVLESLRRVGLLR